MTQTQMPQVRVVGAPKGVKASRVIHAWALVRKDGAVAPIRFKLRVSDDLKTVECDGVEVGIADYRAITAAKVMDDMSRVTPWLDEKVS